ncbi:hypothetical protein ACFL4N_04085 [Thermodesulfobacteriota bacterium]
MSVVSSVDCPVCGAEKLMMEDYEPSGEAFYHCHMCGYGNLFTEMSEASETCFTWDRRCERRKFTKMVEVKDDHGLLFAGEDIPFYPIEAEFDEYSVYPRSQRDKLVWKLYSPDKKLLGVFPSLGEAFEAGDEYADN